MKVPLLNTPVKRNVLLAPYTTWKIGGVAEYFAEPQSHEIPALLKWAYDQKIPVHFLGRGSNMLIASEGLKGLVILTRNSLQNIRESDGYIYAEAGVSLRKLSRFAARIGVLGFEFMIGIPGTVGGGVTMNAGLTVFRPREMVDVLESCVVVSPNGELRALEIEELNPRYRYTNLQKTGIFLLEAKFKMEAFGDPNKIHENTIAHLQDRKKSQPIDKDTAGSVFKTPDRGKAAWWYIDQLGLKGYTIGGAKVCEKHANWIENTGGARANDVKNLIIFLQKKVEAEMGVFLETEIEMIGFKT